MSRRTYRYYLVRIWILEYSMFYYDIRLKVARRSFEHDARQEFGPRGFGQLLIQFVLEVFGKFHVIVDRTSEVSCKFHRFRPSFVGGILAYEVIACVVRNIRRELHVETFKRWTFIVVGLFQHCLWIMVTYYYRKSETYIVHLSPYLQFFSL